MNLDLLKSLVRLANNNPNEHEANLAARRACKMLDQFANSKVNQLVVEQAKPEAKQSGYNPFDIFGDFYTRPNPFTQGQWHNPYQKQKSAAEEQAYREDQIRKEQRAKEQAEKRQKEEQAKYEAREYDNFSPFSKIKTSFDETSSFTNEMYEELLRKLKRKF